MRFLRAGLVVAACLALPAAASATVTRAPNGHRLSLMLRHGIKGGGGSRTSSGAVLLYHRGPVLTAEAPYLIYWTPGGTSGPYSVASSSTTLLDTYMSDVAAASGATTNVYSVLDQYGAPYNQTFSPAQVVTDTTNSYPGSGCSLAPGMTACVSDASIRAEIASVIAANNLTLSTPGSGTTPVFFVITPADVNVCTSTSQCVNNSFCAYHSYFTDGKQDVLYASVPFSVFANGNTKGCQTDAYPNTYETPAGAYHGDEAYNVADDLSHELSETITDPLINAWYSKNGLEVGDLCEAYGATNTAKGLSLLAYSPAYGDASKGTLYDQLINGDQYYNQTEYSNSAGQCMAA